MTAEIDWARSQRLAPAAYAGAAAARRTALPAAEVAEHYAAYEELKHQRRLIDFDDLLSQGIAELQRDPAYAAAVRWRFRHLFVDEFQDVNPLQHALLDAWLGGRDDLLRGRRSAAGHLRLDRCRRPLAGGLLGPPSRRHGRPPRAEPPSPVPRS